MEKEKILRDSVRKLLELNITDREIIENLKSVGVNDETAKRLLNEVKSESPKGEAAENEGDDIYRSAYEGLENGKMKTPVVQKQIRNPAYSSPGSGSSPYADRNLAELWEKGILATVDAKLTEMERLKSGIDSVLDAKIKKAVQLESKKIETVLDSQRALFNTKVDSHLEAKAGELKNVLESRAKQLEDLHSKVQEQIVKVQGEKRFSEELLNQLNDQISSLETVKSQMISDTNKSIIQTQSKFEEFMDESRQKRDEMEARLNRALQLESKVTEGLLEDAKHKIEEMQLDKEHRLEGEVQKKIDELDEMARKVDPKGIMERLNAMKELEQQLVSRQREIDSHIGSRFKEVSKELEKHKKEVSKIESSNISELEKEYRANVDELFSKALEAFDKKFRKKLSEIEEKEKQLDLEKFNATMESLDLFKKQFVNTVTKSVEDYNKSKKELSEAIIERDRTINDYLKRIDGKMRELNDFEQKFAKEVSELIDRIPGEKQKKQPSPKKSKS